MPIYVRLVPMGTTTIMQRAVLLQARPTFYSAVGGETTVFAGYTAHLYAVGIVGTYGHSNDNAASSTTVGAILYCATHPTLLLGQMLPVSFFFTVGARTVTVLPPPTLLLSDAARFLYGWRRDPLLCYPPPHYCWGRCCPFFIRLVREPLLSYPPLRYCRGRCCPFFIWLAARTSTVLPPPYTTVGQVLPVFLYGRRVGRPFTVLPSTLHLG